MLNKERDLLFLLQYSVLSIYYILGGFFPREFRFSEIENTEQYSSLIVMVPNPESKGAYYQKMSIIHCLNCNSDNGRKSGRFFRTHSKIVGMP
jgi:hypothetical protein